MIRVFYVLQLAKRHISGQVSEKTKSVAISIVELCLIGGINLLISQSVRQHKIILLNRKF